MTVTDEMVDRAIKAWFASPPSETDQGLERSMRAALEAALGASKPVVEYVNLEPYDWRRDPMKNGGNGY